MRWIVSVGLFGACGNDRAPVGEVDATPDSEVLPDTPPPPPGCDWAELDDPLNDITLGNGAAEATNLVLGESLTICGEVHTGHFIDPNVDIDGYAFEIAVRTELRVDFAGDAAALGGLEVQVLDAAGALIDRGSFVGSHVAFHTTLNPGVVRLVVIASNPTDPASGFAYKLRAIANPASCAKVAGTPAHAETDDGPQDDRNDMIEIRYATDERILTAATNDAPEATGVITAAGTDLLITGTSADRAGDDEFPDRDTFLIETGTHDELALRVDWTGDADLDVFVFPEGSTAELASSTRVGKTGPETTTFPVLPSTRYWLWVGAYDSSTGASDYEISLCPTTFTPGN